MFWRLANQEYCESRLPPPHSTLSPAHRLRIYLPYPSLCAVRHGLSLAKVHSIRGQANTIIALMSSTICTRSYMDIYRCQKSAMSSENFPPQTPLYTCNSMVSL